MRWRSGGRPSGADALAYKNGDETRDLRSGGGGACVQNAHAVQGAANIALGDRGCAPAGRRIARAPNLTTDGGGGRAGQLVSARISPESGSFPRFRSPIWLPSCRVSPLTSPLRAFSVQALTDGRSCGQRKIIRWERVRLTILAEFQFRLIGTRTRSCQARTCTVYGRRFYASASGRASGVMCVVVQLHNSGGAQRRSKRMLPPPLPEL